jgi:hypothetical protein
MDLVAENKNGFTFPPENVETLAQLMLKISETGFPLAAFGVESRRIIGHWGPERFAAGLRDAVETALKTPARKAGLLDRLLVKLLRNR